MALARLKDWDSGEVLTASDLNAEINNILNNAISLLSPLTGTLDFNGKELILNVNQDTSITADTDDRIDFRLGGSDVVVWTGSALAFNEQSADVDFRVEGLNNANLLLVDAGQDAISLGGANVDGTALALNNLTDRTAFSSVGTQLHVPAQTQNFDNASSTIGAGVTNYFGIPTHTNDTATLTITQSATVYIEGAPVASTNVTHTNTGYSLWVDAGAVRLDGALRVEGLTTVGGNIISDTDSTDDLGTSSVRWANVFTDSIGDSAQSLTMAGNVLLTQDAPATPAANVVYRDSLVKGWAELTGATWTISRDLNISSITDNGTGDFTVNWARAFADADYAIVGIAVGNALMVFELTTSAKSATIVRIGVSDGTSNQDPSGINLIAIGGQ